MEPAREIGGDFFDVVDLGGGTHRSDDRGRVRQGRAGRSLHDVEPHADEGVRPSVISGPGEVLAEVNTLLEADNRAQMVRHTVSMPISIWPNRDAAFTPTAGTTRR